MFKLRLEFVLLNYYESQSLAQFKISVFHILPKILGFPTNFFTLHKKPRLNFCVQDGVLSIVQALLSKFVTV